MTGPPVLTEQQDQWLVPYRGMAVLQIRVSYQLSFVLDGGAEITVEQPATLTVGPAGGPNRNAEPVQIVPERQAVVAALTLFGARVLSSVAFKSGSLRVVFDNGTHLNVKPDADYEAWGVTGPDNLRVICMPGGGLTIWR